MSVVRRLFLMAASGGSSFPVSLMTTFQGFLAYASAGQFCPDRQVVALNMDSEIHDTESMHFTSSAALTGTVSKTASSTTVTGSSTLFSTELSVGQVIRVRKQLTGTVVLTNDNPIVVGTGTAFLTECAIGQQFNAGSTTGNNAFIKSIADNTHLTLDHAPANLSPNPSSASTAYASEHLAVDAIASDTSLTVMVAAATTVTGATATRCNYAAAIRSGGYWDFYGYWQTNTNLAQDCACAIFVNGVMPIGAQFTPWTTQPNNIAGVGEVRLLPRHLAVGDILFMVTYWDDNGNTSGGTVGGTTPYTMTAFGGHLIGT